MSKTNDRRCPPLSATIRNISHKRNAHTRAKRRRRNKKNYTKTKTKQIIIQYSGNLNRSFQTESRWSIGPPREKSDRFTSLNRAISVSYKIVQFFCRQMNLFIWWNWPIAAHKTSLRMSRWCVVVRNMYVKSLLGRERERELSCVRANETCNNGARRQWTVDWFSSVVLFVSFFIIAIFTMVHLLVLRSAWLHVRREYTRTQTHTMNAMQPRWMGHLIAKPNIFNIQLFTLSRNVCENEMGRRGRSGATDGHFQCRQCLMDVCATPSKQHSMDCIEFHECWFDFQRKDVRKRYARESKYPIDGDRSVYPADLLASRHRQICARFRVSSLSQCVSAAMPLCDLNSAALNLNSFFFSFNLHFDLYLRFLFR